MIQPRAAAVAALVWALSSSAVLAADAPVADQIRQLEKDVNAAYAANDLPTYFSFYADDLRAMYPEGPTNLPDYKSSWTALIKAGGGIAGFKYSDLQVQVGPSGDVAVASYQAIASTRTPGKGVSTESFNETDVWFKRNGAWKIVEIHYSENPPAK
ncbi:MAG: nuclear transport factor 2 family protein [Caulobacteraceae bacterium]|nr:nuclear transport factor 2 family protein [Caulobacteraceae bacterium]